VSSGVNTVGGRSGDGEVSISLY